MRSYWLGLVFWFTVLAGCGPPVALPSDTTIPVNNNGGAEANRRVTVLGNLWLADQINEWVRNHPSAKVISITYTVTPNRTFATIVWEER